MSNHSEIEHILHKVIGLDTSSIGSQSITRAVTRRMSELGMVNSEQYIPLLQTSSLELGRLIEEVVIPETWFFRDGEPFKALVKYALDEWMPVAEHEKKALRVLSIPCSSGEEPYSIAMSLLEAGFPEEQFTIDAVDISVHALARAKRAIYGANSFRGINLEYRDRYFAPTPEGYALQPRICSKVTFRHGNILNPMFLKSLGVFDVVFCRNVLIYFDEPTQLKVIRSLDQLLGSAGMLFVGHAETIHSLNQWFVSARYSMAFAYRKLNDDRRSAGAVSEKHEPNRRKSHALPKAKQPIQQKSKNVAKHQTPLRQATPITKHNIKDDGLNHERGGESLSLHEIKVLADRGSLDKAAELCETHITQYGASAEACYLRGLIYQAEDNLNNASDFFNKALYLDPNFYEVLVHLALLAERQGDEPAAQLFWKRAKRVQKRQSDKVV